MEALYSALEGEISTFVRHMQQCQEGFDLQSLYHMLLLVLPRSPSGQGQSWQHLQRLAHCQPGSASPDVASSYVDWLASYLQHLSTLKERFDARVVVPLCENLYMHEEPAACPTQWSLLASILHLAAQLFAHQRNWGLLLQGGTLSQRVFSPQSLHDLCGFADVGPFVKVLRLVPDLSLSPELGHSRSHPEVGLSSPQQVRPFPATISTTVTTTATAATSMEQSRVGSWHCTAPSMQKPSSPLGLPNPTIPLQPSGTGSGAGVLQAQLQESQEELLALLHCREWAATLGAQARGVSQHIHLLCLQQQGEGRGPAQPWQSSGMGMGTCWSEAALAQERQKSLELEEYHHSTLEADWLLELEVRPILIQRIDAVLQRCQTLEKVLRGQTLPVPQHTRLRNRMCTCAPGQAQPSTSASAASPWSSQ